jgi:hypothetical protein
LEDGEDEGGVVVLIMMMMTPEGVEPCRGDFGSIFTPPIFTVGELQTLYAVIFDLCLYTSRDRK